MDLPQFTIMPTGLDDWDRIWNRREGDPPQIHAPRLRDVVRMHLRSPDVQLRPHPVAAEADQLLQRGQRPRRAVPGVPAVAALHRLRHARPAVPVRLHQHPPVPHRPGLLRAHQVHRAAESPAQGGPPPRGPGPVPARLRARPPGRVPLRPVGPPRQAVPEGRVPGPADDRPDRRQGRVGDDPLRVLRAAAAHERGAGPGGRRQAAEMPGPAPAPGRFRARRLRQPRPG